MSVYFISARELDLVKIGYAFDPVRRWHHLRTSSPVELTLEGAIPGGRDKERELHRKFALARTRGEWFRLSPNLQAEIDESTRPERFTWAAVRKWRATLVQADKAIEREAVPAAVSLAAAQHLQAQLDRSAIRRGMTELQRREADGDICFPFRERAEREILAVRRELAGQQDEAA